MENEELANVLSNGELDNNGKIEAIQKLVSARYVSADILANERKKFKETLESQQTNFNNLQTEFNDYKQSKMTEEEKTQEKARTQQEEYEKALKKASTYSAKAVFAEAGLQEEDYSDFLEDIVGLDEEKTKSLAQKICQTITKQKENKAEEIKNNIINGTTPPPAGNSNKTIAEMELEKYENLLAEAKKNNNTLDIVYYERLISEAKANKKV